MDMHDIIGFSISGEQVFGVVIEHIDDFYVVYADYALYETFNSFETVKTLLDNVVIPACDMAITEFRLGMLEKEIKELKKA